jgi:hypothetical protein
MSGFSFSNCERCGKLNIHGATCVCGHNPWRTTGIPRHHVLPHHGVTDNAQSDTRPESGATA